MRFLGRAYMAEKSGFDINDGGYAGEIETDILINNETSIKPEDMRTGFIAIVGRPNVGKSTLLNALLGEKVAIVSQKPQTTRNRITGILTLGCDQFVFLDTPGMHKPKTKLGNYMVKSVRAAIGDTDAAILVVEPGGKPGDIELGIIERLKNNNTPAILAINKTDRSTAAVVGQTITEYAPKYDFKSVVPISAKNNRGVDIVLKECRAFMKPGPWHFPEDELTDQPERQIAAEVIREKLLRLLSEEIPHGIAVVIEKFEESPAIIRIAAEIYCERESHKAIIIGKNGEMLKKIGSYTREDLESFFGCQIYLNLWVKVKTRWRDDISTLRNFGYSDKDEL
jgi:GTP-binding protein Era